MVGYTQSTEKKRGRPVDGARLVQESILMGCIQTPEQSTPLAQEPSELATNRTTSKK